MTKYLKNIEVIIDNSVILTDVNGRALINKLSKGQHDFTVRKNGYVTKQAVINVPTELTKQVDTEIVTNNFQIIVTPNTAEINITITDITGNITELQYIGQTPVINGNFGDLVEYEILNEGYESIEGSFYLKNPEENGSNNRSFEMVEI